MSQENKSTNGNECPNCSSFLTSIDYSSTDQSIWVCHVCTARWNK